MTGITVPDSAKLGHPGKLLLIGFGMVPQCLAPMLYDHLGIDWHRVTIIDADPVTERRIDKRLTGAGARFIRQEITPENAAQTVAEYAGPGGTVINLTTGIDSCSLAQACADQPLAGDPPGVRLLDASCEVWPRHTPPQAGYGTGLLMDHTLYARECRVRSAAASWAKGTGTYLGGIGANPGLIEVWARQCLADQALYMLAHRPHPLLLGAQRTAVEKALEAEDWAQLAHAMDVQALIDSERDDSAAAYPRVPGEDACTWSPEGWIEEAGWNTVQLGWGTAQMHRPGDALSFDYGPLAGGRMIVLPRLAAETLAIGWTPQFGHIIGYVVPHMENVWLTEAMTVYDGDGVPVWNPSVWYTYCPPDLTRAATLEFEMRGWQMGARQVALTDEHIRSGRDELGILSVGPPVGWYCGASTTEEHVRRQFADCDPATFNATTAQVAAGVLAGLYCVADYPNQGYITPEFVADHYRDKTLALIDPYVGGLVSVPTSPWNWHPELLKKQHPLAHLRPVTPEGSRFQWDAFLLR